MKQTSYLGMLLGWKLVGHLKQLLDCIIFRPLIIQKVVMTLTLGQNNVLKTLFSLVSIASVEVELSVCSSAERGNRFVTR